MRSVIVLRGAQGQGLATISNKTMHVAVSGVGACTAFLFMRAGNTVELRLRRDSRGYSASTPLAGDVVGVLAASTSGEVLRGGVIDPAREAEALQVIRRSIQALQTTEPAVVQSSAAAIQTASHAGGYTAPKAAASRLPQAALPPLEEIITEPESEHEEAAAEAAPGETMTGSEAEPEEMMEEEPTQDEEADEATGAAEASENAPQMYEGERADAHDGPHQGDSRAFAQMMLSLNDESARNTLGIEPEESGGQEERTEEETASTVAEEKDGVYDSMQKLSGMHKGYFPNAFPMEYPGLNWRVMDLPNEGFYLVTRSVNRDYYALPAGQEAFAPSWLPPGTVQIYSRNGGRYWMFSIGDDDR